MVEFEIHRKKEGNWNTSSWGIVHWLRQKISWVQRVESGRRSRQVSSGWRTSWVGPPKGRAESVQDEGQFDSTRTKVKPSQFGSQVEPSRPWAMVKTRWL